MMIEMLMVKIMTMMMVIIITWAGARAKRAAQL